MRHPLAAAQVVAERTVRAWSGSFAGSEIGIPLGAVAGLTLLQPPDQDADQLADQLIAADDDEIAALLVQIWCFFTILRPELAMRCGPFGWWLDEEPRDESKVSGAAAVVRVAVESGLFDLTPPREAEVDILGHVHQELASKGSRKAQGQFYTPPTVAEMMAKISAAGMKPGQSICDPAAGTGGLLRAAAQAIRSEGGNPHEIWWYACDVDPVAVAALAVNFHIWGLGPRVVVGCADVLANPEWEKAAREEQLAAIKANERNVVFARLLVEAKALFAGDDGPEENEPRKAA